MPNPDPTSDPSTTPSEINRYGLGDNITGDKVMSDKVLGDKVRILPDYLPPKEISLKVPKLRADQIIGRDQDLEDLHQRLFNQHQMVLLNGLGGVGKTALAQVYLTTYYDHYAHVLWVEQLSGDLVQDVITTAELLERLQISTAGSDPQELFKEVLTKLISLKSKPCLWVIDNADGSLAQYYDSLPSQPNWHLLVTSREEIRRFDLKVLDFLSEELAIDLFLKHYQRGKFSRDEIKTLVQQVDYHTLTIEILAKTAHNRRHLTVKDLQQALQRDLEARVYVDHQKSDQKVERVMSYLRSIFNLSNLSEDEIWLLQQFTCLPPDFHTYDLLETLIKPGHTDREERFSETLEELRIKGWLLTDPTGDKFKMHRILSEVVTRAYPVTLEPVEGLVDQLTHLLEIDDTKDNPVDKFQWIPFGQACVERLDQEGSWAIATLQNNLALRLGDLGEYEGARQLLQKVMASAECNFGPEHPSTARIYSNLALVLKALGEYEGAKRLLQKAMASDERNFGPEHPTTAVRYSNLATVLQELGEYEGAKQLLQKAMDSAEYNFGPEHPSTARCYSNLATVLRDLGEYEGAKQLLQKAMASDERNFGPEHPTTAASYSNLATVLQALGDYEEAKLLLQKAMDSTERNFGHEHPTTAVIYSNLALVLKDLGEYEGANLLLRKAIASYERNFGPEHPTTAVSYSNLALMLKDLGEYEGAKQLLQKAMAFNERNFGPEHPSTARSYSNLAVVLTDLGEYEGAKQLLEKAMASDERNFGPEHPSTARSYANLATVLQDLGEYELAKELLLKAITSDERNFGPDHPTTAVHYSALASVLSYLSDYQGAIALAEKALHVFSTVLPSTHPYIDQSQALLADLRYQFGISQIQDGGWYEGLAQITECLGYYRTSQDRIRHADALQQLARVHYLLSNFDKALIHYRDALRLYQHQHNQMGEAMCHAGLGRLLLRLNYPQDAFVELQQAETFYQHLGDPARLADIQKLQAFATEVFARSNE